MLADFAGSLSTVLVSVLAFLVMLPVIVFVHELGHFQTGRILGIRIDAFSIGFGPELKRWVDRHGTVWRISALPLGGYVKFFGDANAASTGAATEQGTAGTTQFPSRSDQLAASLTEEEQKVCFHFRPVWQRALVVAAGPAANFVLAVVIFAGLFIGLGRTEVEPVVGLVAEDSAAAEAGFEPGDRILTLNGQRIRTFNDLTGRIRLSSGEELTFVVERGGASQEIRATPRRVEVTDGFGNTSYAGQLGVGSDPRFVTRVRFGPLEALQAACGEVGRVVSLTVRFFGRLLTLKEDPREIGGPLRIGQMAGQAASLGFTIDAPELTVTDRLLTSLSAFLSIAALISISVGFLNLLPVPVLDGGHLMFYAYEAVAGRPMNEAVQGVLYRFGMVAVFGLIAFVVVNDVARLAG
ncbi:M50 family metallopeptidase [Parvularcula maris]|uniref:Site-2 protease family protein n=1 Tax=Parvularcula maris TaxID=2965077 RepID=A0A9X2RK99_9PROT|nr:M50 family metallopeptidase [Parvularcula maris]MCQ8185553.1 site-2 protease family protein [Parvularcula maris]